MRNRGVWAGIMIYFKLNYGFEDIMLGGSILCITLAAGLCGCAILGRREDRVAELTDIETRSQHDHNQLAVLIGRKFSQGT